MEVIPYIALAVGLISPFLAWRAATQADGRQAEKLHALGVRVESIERAELATRIAVVEADARNVCRSLDELKGDVKTGLERLEREMSEFRREVMRILERSDR